MASTNPCINAYDGSSNSVFFISKETGIVEELGHRFDTTIFTTKCSFTAFVNIISDEYETAGYANFVSRDTFLRWWFAWAGAKKIDFRRNVDPFCGPGCRDFVAADGTHAGVSIVRQKLVPIHKSTSSKSIMTLHC